MEDFQFVIMHTSMRDSRGKFRKPYPGAKIATAIRDANSEGSNCSQEKDGWWFIQLWLTRFFLWQVSQYANNAAIADRWYGRYQAVRDIK